MALEDTLRSWAKAPGQTELDKCDNAVTGIRKAINANPILSQHSIKVFAQGSYCNRTNVREDSDVDVCVLCTDSLISDFPEGMQASNFGLSPAEYRYDAFKDDVGSALADYFKNGHVTPGKKAFDIKENTYRISADAVPCFEHRRYRKDGTWVLPTGTAFFPDNGGRIMNWPDQNYSNGVTKNTATGGRFKDVVRILKRFRYKMYEDKIAADPIPSFLVECLVWNAPNTAFGHDTYVSDVREVLANLFNNMITLATCAEWGEINELKYLFKGGNAWTLAQAHSFISAAWDYWGFQ